VGEGEGEGERFVGITYGEHLLSKTENNFDFSSSGSGSGSKL
jgi:hypothetical protein